MVASLRALLSGILDYAGLFPPAQLPLEQAIRNYARYRTTAEAWLLSHFICPAARLAELTPFVEELFAAGPPLLVSALGRSGTTPTEFHSGLDADLRDMTAFRQRHGERIVLDVLETRLPSVVAAGETRQPLEQAILATAAADGPMLFVEVPAGPHWQDAATETLAAIGALSGNVGFKLRCGGLEASAVPAVGHVARTLTAGVPVKATAGLHHPFRQHDAMLGVMTYGFLNLFVAGVLAHAHHLRSETVEAILLDDQPAHFVFLHDGLRWGDWHVSTDEIQEARRRAVLSFGSCSFDEPVADLRALNLNETKP